MYYKNGTTYRNAVHYRLHDTLVTEVEKRGHRGTWQERERLAMLRVINDERQDRGKAPMPISEVERVETMAMGHTDYGTKFALYCSELVEGQTPEEKNPPVECGTCGWQGRRLELAHYKYDDGSPAESKHARCPECFDEDQVYSRR